MWLQRARESSWFITFLQIATNCKLMVNILKSYLFVYLGTIGYVRQLSAVVCKWFLKNFIRNYFPLIKTMRSTKVITNNDSDLMHAGFPCESRSKWNSGSYIKKYGAVIRVTFEETLFQWDFNSSSGNYTGEIPLIYLSVCLSVIYRQGEEGYIYAYMAHCIYMCVYIYIYVAQQWLKLRDRGLRQWTWSTSFLTLDKKALNIYVCVCIIIYKFYIIIYILFKHMSICLCIYTYVLFRFYLM